MLLGDSITEISCWRTLVWNQITSTGLASNVDFVGTMSNLQSKCTRPANFDPNHEGHSGWQAYDIARNNIVGWVQNTKPDIVQFMLGTNDAVSGGRSVQTILDAYTTMLNAMRAANPNVKVIVGPSKVLASNQVLISEIQVDKLIPTRYNDATIESLNSAIPGWVQQRTTAQSPIVVADCSRAAGFTDAMFEDALHPNLQGDQFMAGKIGPPLIQFVKDVLGGGGTNPPLTTTSSTPQPTGGPCAALWGQCGGQDWTGPTCCSQGTCKVSNQWYSQCV